VRDPRFARAYAGLANTYTTDHFLGWRCTQSPLRNGLDFARKALELDPDDPLARTILTWALPGHGRREEAELEVERVLSARPGDADVLAEAGHALFVLGRAEGVAPRTVGVAGRGRSGTRRSGRVCGGNAGVRRPRYCTAASTGPFEGCAPGWITCAFALRGVAPGPAPWLTPTKSLAPFASRKAATLPADALASLPRPIHRSGQTRRRKIMLPLQEHGLVSKRAGARLLATLTAAIALAAAPLAGHAQDVKVGALMPMTGDLQAYGETSLNGVKLAVEQVNAAGGVLGGNATIELGDTQTAAQPSIDAAQKLVNVSGVVGIIGALSSGNTIPVAKSVTSKAGVPQISSASTSPTITGLDDNDFLFRTVPSDAFQGVALAEVTRANNLDQLSVIYVNNDYGEGLAQSFRKAFERAGGKVTATAPYEMGKASYRGELAQLARGNPDGLVLIGYPENGVTILRQALEEGYFTEFVFTDGMKAPEIIEAIGANFLNGSFGTVPQARTDTDSYQRFINAYEKRFGQAPPKPFIDTAYDATMVLLLAVEKAGTTDGGAVRDALRDVANAPGEKILPGEWAKAKKLLAAGKDIDYVGASGSIDFDSDGDVGGSFAHWAIETGDIKTVKIFSPTM